MPEVVAEMLRNVASARNLASPEHLVAKVISREELPALLEAILTDAERRLYQETTTLYRLLGYLAPGADYKTTLDQFLFAAVIGFYDPIAEDLYVVTGDGRGFDDLSEGERATLAHEVVHALQDYHFDLDVTFEAIAGERDRSLAFTAVVEGDATVHEDLAHPRQGSIIPVGGGRLVALADLSRAQSIPAPIERELRFPYTTGAQWIAGIRAAGGTTAIDNLLREPPSSTSVVLHPDRGVDWKPEQLTLPRLDSAMGEDVTWESGGTLGEFHWQNLLRVQLPGLQSAQAAAGWLGDRYDVYVDGEQAVAVFSVRDDGGLAAALLEWLDQAGDTSVEGNLTSASDADGRAFRLLRGPDGFLFVIGSSAGMADGALDALRG
jgi:hypothetical protein